MEEYNNGDQPVSPDPKKGQEQDKEYNKKRQEEMPDAEPPKNESPDADPRDTLREAKDRFDGESPAQKDQPNRIDPEPINEDGLIHENPDEDDELEDVDPDAHKNIK